MKNASTVGTPGIGTPLASLRAIKIPAPPLAEQKAIAHILGTLDDKIELNRRTNETLEAMARALFKSWFVDFDPVHAKKAGRKPEGMDAETAALFPDDFEDSEMGKIPRAWRVASVEQECDGLFDGPHATPSESPSGPVFLGIRNFRPTSIDLTNVRRISEAQFADWTRRVTPRPGDIVFTYEATLGFFALIPPGLRCCLGRRTALVRPKEEDGNPHFLFHWFVSEPFQAFLRAHRQPGSTVDRIWLKDFPKYPVIRPAKQLMGCFDRVAKPLWAQFHLLESQSQALAALRDALLPQLLSGSLRVPEAMRLVEKAI